MTGIVVEQPVKSRTATPRAGKNLIINPVRNVKTRLIIYGVRLIVKLTTTFRFLTFATQIRLASLHNPFMRVKIEETNTSYLPRRNHYFKPLYSFYRMLPVLVAWKLQQTTLPVKVQIVCRNFQCQRLILSVLASQIPHSVHEKGIGRIRKECLLFWNHFLIRSNR